MFLGINNHMNMLNCLFCNKEYRQGHGCGPCCCKSHMGRYAAKKRHGTLGQPNVVTKYVKKRVKLTAEEKKATQRAATRAYQARKRKAYPKWVKKSDMVSYYIEAEKLTLETGIKHEVDHIVPLSNKYVCGLHVPANLQVLPMHENRHKRNKFVV